MKSNKAVFFCLLKCGITLVVQNPPPVVLKPGANLMKLNSKRIEEGNNIIDDDHASQNTTFSSDAMDHIVACFDGLINASSTSEEKQHLENVVVAETCLTLKLTDTACQSEIILGRESAKAYVLNKMDAYITEMFDVKLSNITTSDFVTAVRETAAACDNNEDVLPVIQDIFDHPRETESDNHTVYGPTPEEMNDLAAQVEDDCFAHLGNLDRFLEAVETDKASGEQCGGIFGGALENHARTVFRKETTNFKRFLKVSLVLRNSDNVIKFLRHPKMLSTTKQGYHFSKQMTKHHEFKQQQFVALSQEQSNSLNAPLSRRDLNRLHYIEKDDIAEKHGKSKEEVCTDMEKAADSDNVLTTHSDRQAFRAYVGCVCAERQPLMVCQIKHGKSLNRYRSELSSKFKKGIKQLNEEIANKQKRILSKDSNAWVGPGACWPLPAMCTVCIPSVCVTTARHHARIDIFKVMNTDFSSVLAKPEKCVNVGCGFTYGYPAGDCHISVATTLNMHKMNDGKCPASSVSAMLSESYSLASHVCFNGGPHLGDLLMLLGWHCKPFNSATYSRHVGKVMLSQDMGLSIAGVGANLKLQFGWQVHEPTDSIFAKLAQTPAISPRNAWLCNTFRSYCNRGYSWSCGHAYAGYYCGSQPAGGDRNTILNHKVTTHGRVTLSMDTPSCYWYRCGFNNWSWCMGCRWTMSEEFNEAIP